jgi:hypothetical protein
MRPFAAVERRPVPSSSFLPRSFRSIDLIAYLRREYGIETVEGWDAG